MHLYSDVESWNNNLCDLKLLTRWDNCWSNPTIKIVVELELPTIGPHTVDQQECTIHLNVKLGLSQSKLFKQKDFCYFSCCFGWCDVSIINLTWYIFQVFNIFTNLMSALEASVNHVLRPIPKVTYKNQNAKLVLSWNPGKEIWYICWNKYETNGMTNGQFMELCQLFQKFGFWKVPHSSLKLIMVPHLWATWSPP